MYTRDIPARSLKPQIPAHGTETLSLALAPGLPTLKPQIPAHGTETPESGYPPGRFIPRSNPKSRLTGLKLGSPVRFSAGERPLKTQIPAHGTETRVTNSINDVKHTLKPQIPAHGTETQATTSDAVADTLRSNPKARLTRLKLRKKIRTLKIICCCSTRVNGHSRGKS